MPIKKQAGWLAGWLADEETMLACAYLQGHGAAAYRLGIRAKTKKKYAEALSMYQEGSKFGNHDSATALYLFFSDGQFNAKNEEEKEIMNALGAHADPERASRYKAIADALEINPDLKLGRLDEVLPLPPTKLPVWNGVADALTPASTAPPTY
ncbi:DUF6396 domain-containing protein [Janthinobacterium sp. HLX7-2]|uniref:DUF6396 domain-containing protein n=1 Tax=Janthinobacterium sp. HLX7-2 TaxID=1259331 RepID=UPI003F1F88A1